MPTFAVEKLEYLTAKEPIYRLWRNHRCPLQDFCDEIERDKNLIGELDGMWPTLEDAANGILLPQNKHRTIDVGKSIHYPAYEVKSSKSHLRIYYFIDKDQRRIVVLGGKKKDQTSDIENLKKIIKDYNREKEVDKEEVIEIVDQLGLDNYLSLFEPEE